MFLTPANIMNIYYWYERIKLSSTKTNEKVFNWTKNSGVKIIKYSNRDMKDLTGRVKESKKRIRSI